jgi:Flp pilus assembly protein TadB
MTAAHVGPALLAATAVVLLVPSRTRLPAPSRSGHVQTEQHALLRRWRGALAALAFIGGWSFLGGLVGLAGGGVAAVLAWRVLGSAESPAARRRREELDRDLPAAVHLLAACLAAGSATTSALAAVVDALPGAVADELSLVLRRLELGVAPATVWQELAGHPQLGPLGRAFARAHRSGASVATAATALADDLGARSRARTDELARSVEVRAAAPLGVCFLPAFVLLGVVPMVVGVFTAMRLFG